MEHTVQAYLRRQPTSILRHILRSSLRDDPQHCNFNTAVLVLQILEERSIADGSMQALMEQNAQLLKELAERYEAHFR